MTVEAFPPPGDRSNARVAAIVILGAMAACLVAYGLWWLVTDHFGIDVLRPFRWIGTMTALLWRWFVSFFVLGIDVGIAFFALVYTSAIAAWRILGARTLRTFLQRLALGGQRILVTGLVAVIAVAVWRGGTHFLGAPLFIVIAALMFWTLKTNEA